MFTVVIFGWRNYLRDFFFLSSLCLFFSVFLVFYMCHFPSQGGDKDGGLRRRRISGDAGDVESILKHPACSPPAPSLPSQGFCSSLPRW